MKASTSVTVAYEDGTAVTVHLGPKDYVAFERQYGVGVGVLAKEETVRVEYLYFLAWSALSRTGQEKRVFDDFLGAVIDVEANDSAPLDVTATPTS